jgi:hypothetical protein
MAKKRKTRMKLAGDIFYGGSAKSALGREGLWKKGPTVKISAPSKAKKNLPLTKQPIGSRDVTHPKRTLPSTLANQINAIDFSIQKERKKLGKKRKKRKKG